MSSSKTHAPSPSASPTPAATDPREVGTLSFEQALEELDQLVRKMESGELSLDDSIAAYRRGAELAQHCQGKLANAEQEIAKLDGDVLKPLDPSELRGTQG
jgi:exodeoxyribonuclease VII small subunit